MAFTSIQQSWFARLFARYLLILSLPCLSSGFIYLSARDAEAARRTSDLRNGLGRFVAALESELDRVDRAIISVAWNPLVTRFGRLDTPTSGPDRFRAVEIRQLLAAVAEANPFIEEIGLLFARSDVLITSRVIVFDLASSYGGYVTLGDLEYGAARGLLCGNRRWKSLVEDAALNVGEQTTRGPAYVFTLPLGGTTDLDGSVIAYLSPDEIGRLAVDVHGLADASVRVRDPAGGVLARVGASEGAEQERPGLQEARSVSVDQAHGGRSVTVGVRSAARSLEGTATTPLLATRDGSGYATRIYLVLVVFASAVAVVLASVMARNASRPLVELARLVGEPAYREGRQRWDLHAEASGLIRNLMEENKELRSDHAAEETLLAEALFRQLLSGERRGTDTDRNWMRHHPVLAGAAFVVVIARATGVSQRISREAIALVHAVWESIRSLVARLPDSVAYCGEVDIDHLALVLRLSGTQRRTVVRAVEELGELLSRTVHESSSARLSFAAGRAYVDPLDLDLSYEEARFAERTTGAIASFAWYDDVLEPCGGFYYPIAVEARISEALCSGDEATAVRLFDRVFAENRRGAGSRVAVHALLYSEVSGTLSKVRDELRRRGALPTRFAAVSRLTEGAACRDLAEWDDAVREASRELCGVAVEIKKSHNELLKEQLLRYLRAHYAEDLSLSRLAGHFGLSEVYVSQFLREQTGRNYLAHLETLRLDRARRLLAASPEIPTNVLALKIGYRSSNSFRRAFRRRYGASPKDFALGKRVRSAGPAAPE